MSAKKLVYIIAGLAVLYVIYSYDAKAGTLLALIILLLLLMNFMQSYRKLYK